MLIGLRPDWLARARIGLTVAAFSLIGAVLFGAV